MQQKQTWLVYPWGLRFNPWPRSVGYGSGVAVGYDVGHRQGSNLVLLWLWCQLAATAPIWPLAWELPICCGCGPKKQKKRKKKVHFGKSLWLHFFFFGWITYFQLIRLLYNTIHLYNHILTTRWHFMTQRASSFKQLFWQRNTEVGERCKSGYNPPTPAGGDIWWH